MKTAIQMAAPKTTTKPGRRRAVFADSPKVLTDIYQDDVHMAVWQRESAADLITESQLLTERSFTNYRSSLPVAKLGAGSAGLADAQSGLSPTAQAIQTLTAGDVALLKGESWESNEGAGLVHRSPVVETGRLRPLLTLDFAAP